MWRRGGGDETRQKQNKIKVKNDTQPNCGRHKILYEKIQRVGRCWHSGGDELYDPYVQELPRSHAAQTEPL